MASSWGSSWGSAWADSWGTVGGGAATGHSGVVRLALVEAQEAERRRQWVLNQRRETERIIAESLKAEAEFKAKAKEAGATAKAASAATVKIGKAVKSAEPVVVENIAADLAATLRLKAKAEASERNIALMLAEGQRLIDLAEEHRRIQAEAFEAYEAEEEAAVIALLQII